MINNIRIYFFITLSMFLAVIIAINFIYVCKLFNQPVWIQYATAVVAALIVASITASGFINKLGSVGSFLLMFGIVSYVSSIYIGKTYPKEQLPLMIAIHSITISFGFIPFAFNVLRRQICEFRKKEL